MVDAVYERKEEKFHVGMRLIGRVIRMGRKQFELVSMISDRAEASSEFHLR